MENDILFVAGLAFVALIFPTSVSAFSHNNPPRVPILCAVIGFGLIAYASITTPGGYSADEVPQLVVRVVKSFFT